MPGPEKSTHLKHALGLAPDETPFPWQVELLRRLSRGTLERTIDIPTGLGKTAVMAIWLVARATCPTLPRRLVYVVDRRAVVDQATSEADRLRDYVRGNEELTTALGLEGRPLPISTLRGQFVDNREWLEDPSAPAIIVGTVDMVGSRLLFEGYGVSRKMRPYQAGLLGADTLVVLDEAHLVPPFEKLLETIADGASELGPKHEKDRALVPPFTLMSLSATGRGESGPVFGLSATDLDHRVVNKRLRASKRLLLEPLGDTKLEQALADHAWRLSDNGHLPIRCLVFCNQREVAEQVHAALASHARGNNKQGKAPMDADLELFVGGRRVLERQGAAQRLHDYGFIAGGNVSRVRPAFVVATSAGEVGVDMDADHLVSDVVAWERQVQRWGRVNRRGDGDASVVVVVQPPPEPGKNAKAALNKAPEKRTKKDDKAIATYEAKVAAAQAWLRPLLHIVKHSAAQVSPESLREIKAASISDPELRDMLAAATTPAPLRPALGRVLIDTWSMTSLNANAGRPNVAPWLRGWVDDDLQTEVIWRRHLPVRQDREARAHEVEGFFEAAPPHTSEVLEAETWRVVAWLMRRAKAVLDALPSADSSAEQVRGADDPGLHRSHTVAIALGARGDLRRSWPLHLLAASKGKTAKRITGDLERHLVGATLVVDARLGGLELGLLSPDADQPPLTADALEPWAAGGVPSSDEAEAPPVVRFRVRVGQPDDEPLDPIGPWHERHRLIVSTSEDGDPQRWLIVDKWRHDAATEDDRSAGPPQRLEEHQQWAQDRAERIATRLGLPAEYRAMLGAAARLHDEGKRTERWQRAFNAPDHDAPYAKTYGPISFALLDGYRHELGSLPYASRSPLVGDLPEDLQELALHLIAAHHGFARPTISTESCDDAPPSALQERAREVAQRFVRLQKRWGPWGLAWWEALLRAADQQASRDNDRREDR